METPPGESGQPFAPLQTPPSLGSPSQLHSTARSTQKRSSVKLERLQMPFGQSAGRTHGSQLLPVPRQLPKRCEQVGSPRSGSKTSHSEALPHGQETTAGSQRFVQI